MGPKGCHFRWTVIYISILKAPLSLTGLVSRLLIFGAVLEPELLQLSFPCVAPYRLSKFISKFFFTSVLLLWVSSTSDARLGAGTQPLYMQMTFHIPRILLILKKINLWTSHSLAFHLKIFDSLFLSQVFSQPQAAAVLSNRRWLFLTMLLGKRLFTLNKLWVQSNKDGPWGSNFPGNFQAW